MRAPELLRRHRTTARVALLFLALAGTIAGSAAAAVTAPREPPPRVVFPIVGPASWTDDFGDPRAQGSHEGNDIVSERGAPAVAVEAGKVVFWTTSARAGCMLYLYGKSGTTYLYIHLNNDLTDRNDNRGKCVPGVAYAPGLEDGQRVKAGQLIAFVGDSGDANGYPHLHFEYHPNDGAAVSPFRLLKRADRLLYVLSESDQATARSADEPLTMTLEGTVQTVSATETEALPEDSAPTEAPAPSESSPSETQPAATETEPAPPDPAAGASPVAPPVVIGARQGAAERLLTIRVTRVELSTGAEFTIERAVTLSVPADAVVERVKAKKTRAVALDGAEEGESVTVVTAPIALSLATQLARAGVLSAARVLLGEAAEADR